MAQKKTPKTTKKTKRDTTVYGAEKIVYAFVRLENGKAIRSKKKTCTNREYYCDLMRARRALAKATVKVTKTTKKVQTKGKKTDASYIDIPDYIILKPKKTTKKAKKTTTKKKSISNVKPLDLNKLKAYLAQLKR